MPSVLLIDDSRDYCLLIERAFRRLAPGLGVFSIHTGTDAIQRLSLCGSQVPVPDLVLLDRLFPEPPSGFEILRAARAMAALDAMPIWILSAVHEEEHLDYAAELGADAYLGKPTGDRCMELARFILSRQPWQREEIVGVAYEVALSPGSRPAPAALPSVAMSHALALPDPVAIVAASPLISKEPFHVLMALNEAGIDLALLTDMKCQEDAVNTKRKVFARVMLRAEYAVRQIQRYLPYSEAWYEKRRAENRKS